MKAFLLFPHQIFKDILLLDRADTYCLIESDLYFSQYPFHQQKLIFHRSCLKYYQAFLESQGLNVRYVEAKSSDAVLKNLIKTLSSEGLSQINVFEPHDYWLKKQLVEACQVPLFLHPSPNFLSQDPSVLGEKKTYFQTAFYIQQRKNLNLLIDSEQNPVGGQWSFDTENRKKIPKNTFIPAPYPAQATNQYVLEAVGYVQREFPNNPGKTGAPFDSSFYPCTHDEAEAALELFLQERIEQFGVYEDAIKKDENSLFHSLLSPMINVGLLHPHQILERIVQSKAPLNSIEGFVRQIIGWREFVALLYQKIGNQQRTTNYWGFTHSMPKAFYTGETGIPPVDNAIHRLIKSGYNHHIERLMVLGNFMLLCEIHPDAVYKWFMEMYIDAYDWVMVPNVYGMSQFSDGGRMTTKPYICGSNYILKMSDYPKGDWQAVWDGLFWRFLDKQRVTFAKNPRWAMLISTWDKMPTEKKERHLLNAETYLGQLFKGAV
jgi:deoxyribodipyrimidine photolyase-related protein